MRTWLTVVKTDVGFEQVAKQAINLRSSNNSLVTYKNPKVRTLCDQNSYMVRVSHVKNSLLDELRNPDISFTTFKSNLFKYYLSATLTVFDVEAPQTWKLFCQLSVTVLDNLTIRISAVSSCL